VKIALAQLNFHIGNFEENTGKILNTIEKAKQESADLVVFAELAISGYPPRDFLEFSDFINKCLHSVEKIKEVCTDIAVIVGCPSPNTSGIGKPLFNSAFFIANKEIKHIANKSLLPNYDIFDEYRYFEPSSHFECIEYKGEKIALSICEDIWDVNESKMYSSSPMDQLIKQNPSIAINISASPFSVSYHHKRLKMLKANAVKYSIPIVYVNHVGAQTELIFDGNSTVTNANGDTVLQLKEFEEDLQLIDTSGIKQYPVVKYTKQPIAELHKALVLGVRDYFRKLGFKQAILGLSGGIDSAVTSVIAAEALGPENVINILLPSPYSSQHSIDDSVDLCKNLGSTYDIIPIENQYNSFNHSLEKQFKNLPFDLTEENIQARIRGVFLMALSNKFNYILLNTSNKSENAVGYGTLYGDMCGGLSVLGDVYKTQVYDLANYINRNSEIIPKHILIKEPSAELRPNQKDSDSLPDYTKLDEILQLYIENRKAPSEIIQMGYDETLVKRILKMVNINEYKRHQTPPILRCSEKAFGMGRRMPIVGKYLS
jgi:NAD+ synthase (glutamine-hydrolysing)